MAYINSFCVRKGENYTGPLCVMYTLRVRMRKAKALNFLEKTLF